MTDLLADGCATGSRRSGPRRRWFSRCSFFGQAGVVVDDGFPRIDEAWIVAELSVYFIDGQIGGAPQSMFGHPTTKRKEYTQVKFRVRRWNPKLNRWDRDHVTSTSEVSGESYYCLASRAFVPAADWEIIDDDQVPSPPVEAGAAAAATEIKFRVRRWNPKLNLWEWETVTATSDWEIANLDDDADPFPPVEAGATAAAVAASGTPVPDHDCMENAVPYVSDGPLGHGWECGVCGEFLQAG